MKMGYVYLGIVIVSHPDHLIRWKAILKTFIVRTNSYQDGTQFNTVKSIITKHST